MRHRRAGFTLIELMIVVAIIGILAAIAIPAYQNFVLKSKISEVQIMLSNIKNAELSHFAIHNCFEPTAATPPGVPNATTRAWVSPLTGTPPCDGSIKSFLDIGVAQDAGAVRFTYQCAATAGVGEFNCTAIGDLDDSGLPFAEYMACSDINGDGLGIVAPSGTICSFPWTITRTSAATY
jgi:type IV pilus assembly protein PilA